MQMLISNAAMKGNWVMNRPSTFNKAYIYFYSSVVEFASLADMKTAIEKLDDTELNGRRIRLVEDRRRNGGSGRGRSSSSRSRSRSRRRSRSRSRRSSTRSRSKSRNGGSKSPVKSRSHSRSVYILNIVNLIVCHSNFFLFFCSKSRDVSKSRSRSPKRIQSRSRSHSHRSKTRSRSKSEKKSYSRLVFAIDW